MSIVVNLVRILFCKYILVSGSVLPVFKFDICYYDGVHCKDYSYLGKEYTFVPCYRQFLLAENHCRARGELLVQIETPEENDFIYNTIVKPNWQSIWLGAANIPGTARFEWLDGTELNYTNWFSGYPWETTTHRNTIVMHHKTGTWYDWPRDPGGQWSDGKTRYICERPRNIEKFYYLDRTYTLNRELKTFYEATKICKDNNQRIVQVKTQSVNEFIYNSIIKGSGCHTWLGATNVIATRTFKWSDGNRLNYSNWYPGQPNQDKYKVNAILMGRYEGQWFEYHRDSRNCFICESETEPLKTEIYKVDYTRDEQSILSYLADEEILYTNTIRNNASSSRTTTFSPIKHIRKSVTYNNEQTWGHKVGLRIDVKMEQEFLVGKTTFELDIQYGLEVVRKDIHSVTNETIDTIKIEETIVVPPYTSIKFTVHGRHAKDVKMHYIAYARVVSNLTNDQQVEKILKTGYTGSITKDGNGNNILQYKGTVIASGGYDYRSTTTEIPAEDGHSKSDGITGIGVTAKVVGTNPTNKLVPPVVDSLPPNSSALDVSHLGKKYTFLATEMTHTFDEAIVICVNRHESLARVTSNEDQDLIYSTVSIKVPEFNGRNTIWLGTTNVNNTRRFKWLDGGIALTYSNWAEGEPSNNVTQRSSIVMCRNTGKWFALNADQKSMVLCEKKISPAIKSNQAKLIESHSNETSGAFIRHLPRTLLPSLYLMVFAFRATYML